LYIVVLKTSHSISMKKYILSLILSIFISACNNNKTNLFVLKSPEETGIKHQNTLQSTKELNVFRYRNFYNGGGVGIADINNDGLSDIYFTINRGANKLYLNKGNFKFEDITEQAGVAGTKPWSTGVVMVDINADGWLDIYVCNAGLEKGEEQNNELFINQKDGTFKESAEEYNLADSGITTHAAFFDHDKDGDLDVYILNNSFIPVTSLQYNDKRELRDKDWKVNDILKGGGDRLLRNDGGRFTDISEESGIYGSLIGFGLGVTLGDINQDDYIDIYVSNDFYERDYLYINQQDGTYKEELKNYMNHLSQFSMGADMADINNDGNVEVFVTDMLPEKDQRLKETTSFEGFDLYRLKQSRDFYHQYMQNTLQYNNNNGSFSEISAHAGVSSTDWSWGALLFDMDSDGYRDIFVCNGIFHELTNQDFLNFFANDVVQKIVVTGKKEDVMNIINKMPSRPIQNKAFQNSGNLFFNDKSNNWGFDELTFSNGAAYADLDNDGDLDLVINNVNQNAMIYQNQAVDNGANYLKVQLEGDGENTFSIGAKISAYLGNQVLFSELIPTRGFQSSVDYISTIGLGNRKLVDSLVVIWPNDKESRLYSIISNQTLHLSIKDALEKGKEKSNTGNKPFFKDVSSNFSSHIENNYVDYNKEILVPKMLSREGPAMAVGDVNGDGFEDVFIGNAAGEDAKLYLQKPDGSFRESINPSFNIDKGYEDTAAILIDVDQDQDLDLIVGSGGNDASRSKKWLEDRVYLNDGFGKFSRVKKSLPSYFSNTSVLAPYDMDQDGDLDIFVGNRSLIGVYGINPSSVLLENLGDGTFKDVTGLKGYEASELGMVTDAKWINLSGDEEKDLLVVGEWMSPVILENKGLYLEKIETNLSQLSGWWNTIIVADFDQDRKEDFILGNKGTNSVYTGSMKSKAKVYINDFDKNGTLDQIFTREKNGKDYPIHIRNELASQITKIKKENLKYTEYAKKSIKDLFDKELIESSLVKEVNESRSMVFFKKTDGQFTIRPLPEQVQWNSVNTGHVIDVNQDGFIDVVLAGGEDNLKPQFGKLDAGYGELLLGSKDGNFRWVPYKESGFRLRGTVRDLTMVKHEERYRLIFGINNSKPKVYALE